MAEDKVITFTVNMASVISRICNIDLDDLWLSKKGIDVFL